MKKAVIYLRFNTEDQELKAQQLKECNDYATNNNLQVIKIYEDCDKSRSQFLNVMLDAKHEDFDYVIAYGYHHISHNYNEFMVYLFGLKKYKVNLLVVQDDTKEFENYLKYLANLA